MSLTDHIAPAHGSSSRNSTFARVERASQLPSVGTVANPGTGHQPSLQRVRRTVPAATGEAIARMTAYDAVDGIHHQVRTR